MFPVLYFRELSPVVFCPDHTVGDKAGAGISAVLRHDPRGIPHHPEAERSRSP